MKKLLIIALVAMQACATQKAGQPKQLKITKIHNIDGKYRVTAASGKSRYQATLDSLPSDLRRRSKIQALQSDTTGVTIFKRIPW